MHLTKSIGVYYEAVIGQDDNKTYTFDMSGDAHNVLASSAP
jgi:hypothetical protein